MKVHRADRADVVREALLSAGIVAPEVERMAADVTSSDGKPRFVWTDTRPDLNTYTSVILHSIAERFRWRAQYDQAKTTVIAMTTAAAAGDHTKSVDSRSATTAEPP